MEREEICDEICNGCRNNRSSRASYRILQLINERDESIIKEINKICPNMSCCPECRVDDFCHVEGCNYIIEGADLGENKK